MTEVVDLTFTDSDDEPQVRVSLPAPAAPTAGETGGMRTPLRRLLARQQLNSAALAAAEAQASLLAKATPASPEAIELLESPEPVKLVQHTRPSQKERKEIERRGAPAPAAAALEPNIQKSPRQPEARRRSFPYDTSEYDDEFAAEESYEPEYLPPLPGGGRGRGRGGVRKPKRTREEMAQERELKKQQKAAETAARKVASQYNSDKHVLRYMTVILDPELMGSPVGLKIAEAFQLTQAQQAEHERITYKVASTCLGGGLRAIKWLRKIPAAASYASYAQESQHDPSMAGPCNLNNYNFNSNNNIDSGSGSQAASQQQILIDEEEPHILICFEAEEFIAAVQRDALTSLFSRLQEHCPGHRPHILVHRLDFCLTKKERDDFKQTMGTGGVHNVPINAFNRREVDDFISKLAIEAPQVGFRDVGSAEEGAGHVCSLTRAIARRLLEKNDANKYLLSTSVGNNKKSSQNTASLLASYPVEDPGVKAFIAALCAMPSVGPQIAHAVAVKYGSLGSLMAMLFDPMKSYPDKIRELEYLPRTGSGRVTKVGPKAAKQLMEILTEVNPDAKVHEER